MTKPGVNEKAAAPTSGKERIHELDALRGFALLGILLSNIAYFASPAIFLPQTDLNWWPDPWHQAAKTALEFLSSFKFLTMFSFLFGLGFMIFLERAERKTARPRTLFLRRLAVLLGFGLVHSFLVWSGDILLTYAVCGPILLLFYRRRARTVLVWALVVLLLPALSMAASAGAIWAGGETALPDAVGKAFSERMVAESTAAYGSGTFADIAAQRLTDLQYLLNGYTVMLPLILGMFLLGVYAAKAGLHLAIGERLPFFRKLWVVSGAIGLPFNTLYIYCLEMSGSAVSVYTMLSLVGALIGGPAMCFFYIASIVLLSRSKRMGAGLRRLQAVGKMSLTNYLLQSVICTLVFYSYGLGLFGKIGPLYWPLIALAVFAAQIALSAFWMSRFRFGPAEWLWRTLTYGKAQPLAAEQAAKRSAAAEA